MDMFIGFSNELMCVLLEEIVAQYNAPEDYVRATDEMLAIWATGDEQAFIAYLNEEVEFESQEEALLYEEYTKALETDRNIGMADFVEEALASGEEVFVCVGAAHVLGRDNMVELLRQRGYTVTLIKE